MTQKNDSTNNENVSLQAFLATLYSQAPDNLWLEIRCIHPVSHEIRTLWTHHSNEGAFQYFGKSSNLVPEGIKVVT